MMGGVALIGAGPGDPGLLTIAGANALHLATAIVHDALVSEAVLAQAGPHVPRYDVGKRAGHHAVTQDEINVLLVSLARAGHTVARLKGGDPYVFGRGGEEGEALAQAGIPFRVIPGVSSAIAVPALAGIPITYRGLAASVGIVTAHRMDGAGAPDWDALAKMHTLIVLMGAERVAELAQRLVAAGRNLQTPIACIQSGTLPEQREVIATLADVAERVQAAGLGSPMTIVVGEVVRVRDRMGLGAGARLGNAASQAAND